MSETWVEELEAVVPDINMVKVYFERGDDDELATDEVVLLAGDCNCPHAHRYDKTTGHGWSEIHEKWKEGDTGVASLRRALARFHAEQSEPTGCKECAAQLREAPYAD